MTKKFELPDDPNKTGMKYRKPYDQLTAAEKEAYDRLGEHEFWALSELGYNFNWPYPWSYGPVPTSVNKGSTLDLRSATGAAVSIGAALPLVYGKQRIAGELFYQKLDDGLRGVYWLALCEGPIDGLDAYYLNGVNGGTAQDEDGNYYLPLNPINKWGTFDQTAETEIAGFFANFSAMPRTAYVKAEIHDYSPRHDFTKRIPGGSIKEWAFDVRALKLYDPRDVAQDPADPTTWTFTANAALVIRDFLVDAVHACEIPHGDIDEDSFKTAADDCDLESFEINMAIVSDVPAQAIREQMELACRGHIYMQDGKYKLFIDKLNASVAAAFDTATNCRSVSYEPLGTQDIPTRVRIDYVNAANKYSVESTTVDNLGVAAGTAPVREARFKSDAITNATQAQRIAAYTLNRAAFSLRVSFVAAYVGVTLKYGDIVTLTTDEGLAAQKFFVETSEEQDNGEFVIRARRYEDAIFDYEAVSGDTPPDTWLDDPTAVPDDITLVGVSPVCTTPGGLPDATAKVIETTVDTATEVTLKVHPTIDYTPATTRPRPVSLIVRWFYDGVTDPTTKVWADMAATEMVIPIDGNRVPYAPGGGTFYIPGFFGESNSDLFYPNGEPSGHITNGGYWRIIIKTRTVFGKDSTGIIIDANGYISSSSANDPGAYLKAKPLGLVEDTLPAVSAAGEATIAMDAADHVVKMSVDGSAFAPLGAGGGSGTVTSVDLSAPSDLLTVGGTHPVTGSGTIALTKPNTNPNLVYAGPASGGAAAAAFRALVAADLAAGVSFAIEQPLGVIDSINPQFTLLNTPISSRILLFRDGGNALVGGIDYGRTGTAIQFGYASQKPRNSLIAAYPYIAAPGTDPGGGEPAPPLYGTANTWNFQTMPLLGWQKIVWAAEIGLFCAFASSRTTDSFATSPDGINWTSQVSPNSDSVLSLYWTGTQFIAGLNAFGKALTSPDGVVWTAVTITINTANVSLGAMVWCPPLGIFVAIHGWNAGAGPMLSSANGIAWTDRVAGSVGGFTDAPQQGMCWSPEKAMAVAVRNNLAIYTYDGITWTAGSAPTNVSAGNTNAKGVIWVRELGLFVQIGAFGNNDKGVATSPDGINWTNRTTPTLGTYGPLGICWSASRQLLVVVKGSSVANLNIWTSPDGIVWTERATPNPWGGVALGNQSIACGDQIDTVVATSAIDPTRSIISLA